MGTEKVTGDIWALKECRGGQNWAPKGYLGTYGHRRVPGQIWAPKEFLSNYGNRKGAPVCITIDYPDP